jgi:threonine/homoserine/homoserine lactone efflux protein
MATLAVVGIVVMSGYALFAARVLRQLCWMNRCFGVLIGRVNARC